VAVTAPASQPQSTGTGRKVAAWLIGIAGVGAIGAGGYFAYMASDRFSKIQKKYDPSLEKEGKNDRLASGILLGAGGAAVLTAIIIGATGGSSGPVALAPAVGPGVAGAMLSGSF